MTRVSSTSVSPRIETIVEDISQDEPREAAPVIRRTRRTRTASENFVENVLKPAGILPGGNILDVVDIPLKITRFTGPIPR